MCKSVKISNSREKMIMPRCESEAKLKQNSDKLKHKERQRQNLSLTF
jgi:hypothetical protein